MATIGMRELRADLAAALRRAGTGEAVTVTVSGAPVARLVPVGAPVSPPAADIEVTVAMLVASGSLIPPRRRRQRRGEALGLAPQPRIDVLLRDVR